MAVRRIDTPPDSGIFGGSVPPSDAGFPPPPHPLMSITRRTTRLALVAMAALVPMGAARTPAPETTAEHVLELMAKSARFTVTVEGSKQGKFKGSAAGGRAMMSDRIDGVAFHYRIRSPRDAASGQASGKRMHSPVLFTKAADASSPQFFQALATNEVLKSVLFEFYGTDAKTAEPIYTVKLVNATVSEWNQYAGEANDGGRVAITDGSMLEDVALHFQRIEIESRTGKTMAIDDWYQGS
jgi:type VI secretion system secreted protein Hcp